MPMPPLRRDDRCARNLLDQCSPRCIACLAVEAFADAVGEEVALQDLEATVEGAELRGGFAIEVEYNPRNGFDHSARDQTRFDAGASLRSGYAQPSADPRVIHPD